MGYEVIIERIRSRTGLSSAEEAERALRVVLGALGASIPERERDLLFGALPGEISAALHASPFERALELAEIRRRVSAEAGVSEAAAVERVETACEVLAEAMSEDARRLVRLHLPEPLAALFRPGEPAPELATHEPPPPAGSGRTLSTGRPGSRHPIAETAPERTLSTGRPGSEHPLNEATKGPRR